jgi:signal transduction histidine kinase/CheY-like chemotaxis protein
MGGDLLEEIQGVNSKGVPWKGSVEVVSAEGEKRHVQLMAYPLAKPASPSAERILIASDGTENLNLRRSLAQAQRMEALGHLAGGIAHDFNNILTIIQSATTYLAEHIPNKDPLQQEVAEILSASARAGELTRQLLTYSRRRSIEKSTSDLNEVIPPLARMLQRLIGENVELQLACSLGRLPVRLDPTQVQQILFNLASNARDAMPEGGILRITTRQEVLSAERARALKTTPGPQGVLEVADTGVGMTAELLDKVFAPYFTTKDEEKGTGIGLATVDAIVRQAGGAITVSSIPGQGTTFTVSMPLQKVPSSPRVRVFDLTPTEVSGLILLAEDEPAVRRLATSVLKQKGYDVVEAADGIEALEQASEIGGTFDILVTDVTMPRMSGLRLAAKLREDRPDLPVLFICGFSEDEAIRGGLQQGDLGYLQKPFTPNELAERVGRLLLEHRLMRPL